MLKKKILWQIQRIQKITSLLNPLEIRPLAILWSDDKIVLIKIDCFFVQLQQLIRYQLDVKLQKDLSALRVLRQNTTSIYHVFNVLSQRFWSVGELSATQKELEIAVFGREFLTSCLKVGIQFFPMVIFVDGFELYRNMY